MLSQGITLGEALVAYQTKIKRVKNAQNVRFNLPYILAVHRVPSRMLVQIYLRNEGLGAGLIFTGIKHF